MDIPFATVMEIPWSTSSSPCLRGVTQRDVGNKMSAISTSTSKTSGKSNVSIVYTVARCSRGKKEVTLHQVPGSHHHPAALLTTGMT